MLIRFGIPMRTRTLGGSVLAAGVSHAVLMWLLMAAPAMVAQEPPQAQTEPGPHQGVMKSVGDLQTETVIGESGIRLYLYDASGQPMDLQKGRGVATIASDGIPKRYRYGLMPMGDHSLSSEMDFSHLAGRRLDIGFQIVGLGESGLQHMAFRTFVTVAAPASEARKVLTVQVFKPTEADAGAIAKQGKCPVMDEPLGSMGQPIKLMVGQKPIFLCCRGCIKRVQADPAKYLTMVHGDTSRPMVAAGTESIRPGVYKVTAADAPFVAAQKNCPVMEEPLDAMGGPFKVDAGGKAIYICCPGCAKLIIADPKKYVAVLAKQGISAPTIRR